MLGIIVVGLLAAFGFKSERLSWRPFALIVVLSVIGVALKTSTMISNRTVLGEDASYLRDPLTFALNVAGTMAMYSAVYLVGFGVGKWRRRGRQS